ncbi:stemmadenine O-acetyltransferase-like isoform X6 [Diospyros lotus]|uniref:stemmadenine O-acetyltransferase-like isoform X1 n=1 Tax=Diospyros lotus TaxID=55363 RepID=UPI002251E2CE|nr:stemmadenine O-acetyltransferase-like isoform X1 [Diospyros lotus]XP_052208463.1 stemmadenine O-acetyltransferase-like isoform X2 [Diospyros lotus]XP_052208464.1 stemmadenine O-acetyltransferase-like isoform X3 [Diospyros lotus]XP_052208466.1 stemmadenine O-acetyltransferase-like isoform X5 [Diospyros lotus]XP_052208467.1 stemmadenine O-acetyltransferase-like isoform X6 [Diospyros lotus]
MDMEIQLVSTEYVKPSSPTPPHLKTFHISLLDQLLASAYVPIVFHFPIPDATSVKQVLARLKTSLSQTLSRFYPLAGRLKDHMSFECNDEGVLFIETHVNRDMSEFLKQPELEALHQFVPYQDFVPEPETTLSHLAIQANVFASGGISIGVSMSHKVLDANTLVSFLRCWTALSRGCQDQAIFPDLSSASSLFPPSSEQLPRSMAYCKESWFNQGKSILRRFVFDCNAIKALKVKATSQLVPYPSSSQVITSLIWTRAMAASATVKGSQHPSTLVFAVNMRPRMASSLSENAFGNIFWLTSAHHNAAHTNENDELQVVVGRVKEAVKKLDSNFIQSMQGDEGFHNIRKLMEERDEAYAKERPEMYMVSDLRSFKLSELDFGWGKPIWVSHVWGFPNSVFVNGVFLVESSVNRGGIEAWVHLDEPEMTILEQDPEFLRYASSNPGFPVPTSIID